MPRGGRFAPCYSTCVTLIESRIVTTNAKVTQRMSFQVQGSKSFKFNGSKLWNELPTNVKHVQQKIRFKKECKALLMTRMKEQEEMNVVP